MRAQFLVLIIAAKDVKFKYLKKVWVSIVLHGFDVDVGSWEVEVAEAKCHRHYAETRNFTYRIKVGVANRQILV